MRFYRRLVFKNRIFSFSATLFYAKTQKCCGITSHVLNEGKNVFDREGNCMHIILWDLENCTLSECAKELLRVQKLYKLDTIRIIADDKPNSFRALCFEQRTLKEYIKILCDTKYVDYNFITYTVKRKYSVIRFSEKIGRHKQQEVGVLLGRSVLSDIPEELQSVVYDTSYDSKTSSKVIML